MLDSQYMECGLYKISKLVRIEIFLDMHSVPAPDYIKGDASLIWKWRGSFWHDLYIFHLALQEFPISLFYVKWNRKWERLIQMGNPWALSMECFSRPILEHHNGDKHCRSQQASNCVWKEVGHCPEVQILLLMRWPSMRP